MCSSVVPIFKSMWLTICFNLHEQIHNILCGLKWHKIPKLLLHKIQNIFPIADVMHEDLSEFRSDILR